MARDEQTPLLGPSVNASVTDEDHIPTQALFQPALFVVLLLTFFPLFAFYHLLAPKLRLIELVFCRNYYADRDPAIISPRPDWPGFDIDEGQCKNHEIQTALSNLRALGTLFDAIVALCLSIPLGILANRYGRKPIYAWGVFSLLLSNIWFFFVGAYSESIDIKWTLLSSFFLIFGGGSNVLLAMAITMAIDITETAQRSTVLYWQVLTYLLGLIAGTGLSRFTMKIPWLPYVIAALALIASLLLAAFTTLPEVSSNALNETTSPDANAGHRQTEDLLVGPAERLHRLLQKSIAYIKGHKTVCVLLSLFPFIATRNQLSELVIPYVSNRYGWPLSKAGTIDVANGSVSIILGLFILPRASQWLRSRNYSAQQTDCIVGRYSAIVLCLGSIIIGLAPNIGVMLAGWILFSTGFGIRMSVLAVVSQLIEPHQSAMLTTTILTLDTLTELVYTPLMWKVWGASLNLGGLALGFPWFIEASAMLLVALVLLNVKLQADDKFSEERSVDDEPE